MDATKITQDVEACEGDFKERNQRMDDDFDLWDLCKTPVADYDILNKQITGVHETDVNIVSNRLRTFADEVHSKLAKAEMQIAVRMAETEGEDKREDMGKLERLFQFALEKGDEALIALLLPPLREQLIWYSSIRGWMAGRFLVETRDKGKTVIFNLRAWDPRWVTYKVGGNDFLWVANKTFQSKSAIKDEYKKDVKDEYNNAVIDYWKFEKQGKISNAVVCDKGFLKEKETYDLKSTPILIMPVATRPPIAGSSGGRGYGDSIFASVRDVNKVRNQFASIIATHANLMANQGLINYFDEQGKLLETTLNVPESIINLPMGHNKLEPTPMKEISPTVVAILNWLEDQVETGTLPHVRVGTPPQSGTLENLVQEARNIVFNPQTRLLSTFYGGICRLLEEQLLANKIKVNVRIEQKNKYYETEVTPIDLGRPHITKVEFTTGTPWTQLDTYQIADMAKRQGLPDAFIHEYILKLPDPKGVGDLSAIEMAEHSPKLNMIRAIQALMKAGRAEEAEQIMRDLYQMEMSEQMAIEGGTPEGEVAPEEAMVREEMP